MKRKWIVEWLHKYAETRVFDSAAEAYNWVFDKITQFSDFEELREELAASFDRDEEDFGIEDVADVYVHYVYD
jgi:hypothetical protein